MANHVTSLTDPSDVASALIEYNKLKMTNETFWEFYSKFQDVAARARITDDDRPKSDLHAKITYPLAKYTRIFYRTSNSLED